jgi:hypothetical protein
MTINAGTVYSTLTADSAGMVRAYDAARAAMARAKQQLDEVKAGMIAAKARFDEMKTSTAGVAAAYEAQAAKTRTMSQMFKDGGAQASRLGGALSALSGAMGENGGAAAKAAGAFGGFAQMLGAGGPVGVALAVAAAAMALLNHEVEKQKKLEDELDAIWAKGTEGLRERRDAIVEEARAMHAAVAGAEITTGFEKFDRLVRMQNDLLTRSAAKQTEISTIRAATVELETKIASAVGDQKEKFEEQLKTRRIALATTTEEKRAVDAMLADAPKLVDAEDAAAKRAAARAKAEQDAADALKEQRDMLRDMANAKLVADMLPNGGRLTRTVGDARDDAVASAFATLQLGAGKGPHLDVDSATPIAATYHLSQAFKDATASVSAMAIDIPRSTMTVAEAHQNMKRIITDEAKAFASSVKDMASAVAAGRGGNAAGTAVGGVVGAGIGVALGDPTGALGGAIGELLGGILGDTLDKLVDALGVLAPIFDGVGLIIDGLRPILIMLRQEFVDLMPIWMLLGHLVLDLAQPIAALAKLVLDLALGPIIFLVSIVLQLAISIVALLEAVTFVAKMLDQPVRRLFHWFMSLINAVSSFYNDIQAVIHGGRGGDRLGYASQSDVSYTSSHNKDSEKDAIKAAQQAAREHTKALKDNTAALNRGTANLSSGYKGAAGAEYNAAVAGRGPPPVYYITIKNWQTNGTLDGEMRRLSSVARRGTIAPSVSKRGVGDEVG